MVSISDHRFAATKTKGEFSDRDLPAMEFLCHYKMDPPHDQHWNEYELLEDLKLLDSYISNVRHRIPLRALNGREFHDCTVVSLRHFCKTFNIDIQQLQLKTDIIGAIQTAILERN